MQMKRGNKTYGEAGPRDAFVMPWQEIHCDTIGPWTIDLCARKVTFNAMTIIDACTNLVEIKAIKTKTSEEGAAAVENAWLARYPKQNRIISDNGPEFKQPFVDMCARHGITHSTISSQNPQGNSIV